MNSFELKSETALNLPQPTPQPFGIIIIVEYSFFHFHYDIQAAIELPCHDDNLLISKYQGSIMVNRDNSKL